MKTSSAGNFRPLVPINGISSLTKLFSARKTQKMISSSLMGKVMMGLALTAMIGSIDVAPALGKNDKHDNGRYEQRGRGHDRGHYVPARRVYRERVYVAPRVVYEPPPPPGISIWFPPIVIRP
jgi:hypothetical protein